MPVQPREHVSSTSTARHPAKLQGSMSQYGARRRPAAASKSHPPSCVLPPSLQLNAIPQKAESQTVFDGHWPTAARLSRVFSLPRLGTNANKSRENISVIPNQCDGIVVSSRRKRLVRHPSRRLSIPAQTSSSQHATPFTSTLPRPPSLCMTDKAPKSLTNKTSFSPLISVGDETDEDSDDPTAHHKTERRLQMARLAKLTRHLGEEIPPELVLSSTLPIDIAEFRSLAGSLSVNLSKGHQRRWSLDPTADPQSAPVLPSSTKLRKSRSLRGTEGILRPQTHGEHAVNVEDGKLPCVLRAPRTEADFLKPSQHGVSSSLRGPDDVNHSLMSTPEAPYGLQSPLHISPPTMPLASTPERLQLRENSDTSELALNNISNMERGEEKPDSFLGVDTKPGLRSLTNRSLHPTGDLAVGIRPSLAQIPSCSDLEVDVQISKRTRFWRMKVGKDVVQSVNPDDIAMQLREMKAST
ncbi:hypothetical protein DEU56DRAFT_488581 [Suillus clintonianus]|uniref:uncharacterized protein n=1 Tax=Suillus clintonianus TaxID=1904413 RepID=UPI001B87E302|nr:uncharacterized protein DEU56DRAFT_488581 [Suillus clintonianus]KAG2129927.1 hypothetical protein DEU56DRAFT_488581 [Suillus clintonianus]